MLGKTIVKKSNTIEIVVSSRTRYVTGRGTEHKSDLIRVSSSTMANQWIEMSCAARRMMVMVLSQWPRSVLGIPSDTVPKVRSANNIHSKHSKLKIIASDK